MRTAILTASLVLLAPLTAQAQWFGGGQRNYEECMIAEMKGQVQSMYPIADKLCSRRFKKEVQVSRYDIEYEWTTDVGGRFAEIVILKSGEYDVTRGKVRFAPKPCSEAKEGDFGAEKNAEFKNNVAKIATTPQDTSLEAQSCMRLIEFRGTYK